MEEKETQTPANPADLGETTTDVSVPEEPAVPAVPDQASTEVAVQEPAEVPATSDDLAESAPSAPDLDEPASAMPEKEETGAETEIFALRTTANREDQVMDFLTSNIEKKGLQIFTVIRPHGMRGYIFIEAQDKLTAETGTRGIPYARGILPKAIDYKEIEHMLEQVKKEINIMKNDIVEIISGPFKRETAKISRIDKQKEEVVVELVQAAVPIPITLKLDAVKVIRRDEDEE